MRWLTGGYSTVEGTAAYFDWLARNAAAAQGKRGFGVWPDGPLAGYIDCDPDAGDGLEADDVNVSCAVHPRACGRGVAVEAIRLTCEFARANQIGTRAAIRVDPENKASVRVAHKSGFTYVRASNTDTHHDGTPVTLSLHLRELRMTSTSRSVPRSARGCRRPAGSRLSHIRLGHCAAAMAAGGCEGGFLLFSAVRLSDANRTADLPGTGHVDLVAPRYGPAAGGYQRDLRRQINEHPASWRPPRTRSRRKTGRCLSSRSSESSQPSPCLSSTEARDRQR